MTTTKALHYEDANGNRYRLTAVNRVHRMYDAVAHSPAGCVVDGDRLYIRLNHQFDAKALGLVRAMKCCLCGEEIDAKGTWTQGHNAQPLQNGRCCSHCNDTKVLPARIKAVRCARLLALP